MQTQDTNHSSFEFSPPTVRGDIVSKLVALLEITFVIGASIICALVAQRLVVPGLAQTLGLGADVDPDFLAAAVTLLKQFALQYGGMLLLVLLFALIRNRRSLRSYALTKANRSLKQLCLIGIVGGAFAALPAEAIFIAKEIYPLGSDTPIWGVVEKSNWDGQFWIFMAVGSFVLVPLLEEAAWRSYVLGRLVESFQPGAALLVTAIAFSLLHLQYLANGDVLGYLTMGSVIFSAIIYGAMTLKTGSLLPAIIAHVMINVPKSFEVGIAVLAAYLLLSVLASRPILIWAKQVLRDVWHKDTAITLALIISLFGIGVLASAFGQTGLIIFGALGLIIVFGHAIMTQSAWAERPDPV